MDSGACSILNDLAGLVGIPFTTRQSAHYTVSLQGKAPIILFLYKAKRPLCYTLSRSNKKKSRIFLHGNEKFIRVLPTELFALPEARVEIRKQDQERRRQAYKAIVEGRVSASGIVMGSVFMNYLTKPARLAQCPATFLLSV